VDDFLLEVVDDFLPVRCSISMVTASQWRPSAPPDRRAQAHASRHEKRPVYFGAGAGTLDAQVLARTALAPGFKGSGPALIEEYGSTTLVWPGDSFEVGALGEIRIHCAQS